VGTVRVWYDHRADGNASRHFSIVGSGGPVAEMESPNFDRAVDQCSSTMEVHSLRHEKNRP
jgi:hypothetical protein